MTLYLSTHFKIFMYSLSKIIKYIDKSIIKYEHKYQSQSKHLTRFTSTISNLCMYMVLLWLNYEIKCSLTPL